jgi:hypothetical protein
MEFSFEIGVAGWLFQSPWCCCAPFVPSKDPLCVDQRINIKAIEDVSCCHFRSAFFLILFCFNHNPIRMVERKSLSAAMLCCLERLPFPSSVPSAGCIFPSILPSSYLPPPCFNFSSVFLCLSFFFAIQKSKCRESRVSFLFESTAFCFSSAYATKISPIGSIWWYKIWNTQLFIFTVFFKIFFMYANESL